MKKLIKSGMYIALCATLLACGGDDDGGSGPSPTLKASEVDFEAPTGSLSSDNAYEIAQKYLKNTSTQGQIDGLPGAIPTGFLTRAQSADPSQYFECSSTSGTGAVIDYDCLNDKQFGQDWYADTGCRLSGKMTYSPSSDGTSAVMVYDNITDECDDSQGFGPSKTVMNGQMDISFGDPQSGNLDVSQCWAIDVTIDGETERTEGCQGAQVEDYLLFVDGESFQITNAVGECPSGVEISVFDASNTLSTISCEITSPTTCSSITEIEEIENCIIN